MDAQDHPTKLQRFEMDRARNMLLSIEEGRRSEEDLGPFGLTEARLYTGDKLLFRTVISYDESGRMLERKTFQLGVLLHTDKYQYGNGLSDSWRFSPNGQVSFHRLSRYDEDGDLVEQIEYDAKGEPVVVFRLHKTELIYFWRNPACGCGSFVSVTRNGTYASYEVDQSGRFKKWVSHYRVPWPGLSTDEETFDASGNMTDRMTYDYVDDAYGNWTTRVTNARDPSTGNMVPIKREVRILTYFARH